MVDIESDGPIPGDYSMIDGCYFLPNYLLHTHEIKKKLKIFGVQSTEYTLQRFRIALYLSFTSPFISYCPLLDMHR